jgi:hypothetical protein
MSGKPRISVFVTTVTGSTPIVSRQAEWNRGQAMATKYTATPNNEVVYIQTTVLARCRTAEEAEQLVSLLNSGAQRLVDDWLAQNDGTIPGDVWERIQQEWRERIG